MTAAVQARTPTLAIYEIYRYRGADTVMAATTRMAGSCTRLASSAVVDGLVTRMVMLRATALMATLMDIYEGNIDDIC